MRITGNRVLLQKIEPKAITEAGILMPSSPNWRDDAKQWRVIAVGSGKFVTNKRTKEKRHVPIEIAAGDKVLVDTAINGVIHLDDGRVLVDADMIEMKW